MALTAIVGASTTAAISRWMRLDDDLTWVRPIDRDQYQQDEDDVDGDT